MNNSEQVINEIKLRLSLADLISQYVSLKQNGSNYVGLCPFHNEKTPSFNVSNDKGFFKCFGCGKSGDHFTFLMEKENYTFPEALKILAGMTGIELEPRGQLSPQEIKKQQYYDLYKRLTTSFSNILLNKEEAKPILDYLYNRGLTLETIQDFQLGYLPDKADWLWNFLKKQNYSESFLAESGLFSKKHTRFSLFTGRVVFPIFDKSKRVIAFSGRQMKNFGPKYINSPDTLIFHKSNSLFGIQHAVSEIRKKKSAYLVEGNFDVLSMHQAGIKNCVAPLGTAFTEAQAKKLQPHAKKVFCLFDGDSAGKKAVEKATKILMKLDISSYVIELPEETDPSDLLKKKGKSGLTNFTKSYINSFDFLLNQAVNQYGTKNIESKETIIQSMMPFIDLMNTELRKSDAMKVISEKIGVDFISLQKDINAKKRVYQKWNIGAKKENKKQSHLPNGELMLLITACSSLDYFKKVRSEFEVSDFSTFYAKDLYISMEDSFRHNKFNSESILNSLENEEIKDYLQPWLTNFSFLTNPDQIFDDSVKFVKLRKIKIKKNQLVGQLNSQNSQTIDSDQQMNKLVQEIQFLTEEIKRLKGEV